MVEKVIKYKSNDVIFDTEKEADNYDNLCILLNLTENEKEPANAMAMFCDLFKQYVTHMHDTMVDNYIELFKKCEPCAFQSSFWRVISDYSTNYPKIYKTYYTIMNQYIQKYGERK